MPKTNTDVSITVLANVEYRFYPATTGPRERGGVKSEPDQPAHVVIDSIQFGGKEIDWDSLEHSTQEDIECQCLEAN